MPCNCIDDVWEQRLPELGDVLSTIEAEVVSTFLVSMFSLVFFDVSHSIISLLEANPVVTAFVVAYAIGPLG